MMDLLYPADPAPLYPRPSIHRPGKQPVPKGEKVPLVEPSGLVYGQATREWCHGGSKALHPVVHLHIIDRFGRIYLQKRSLTKDFLPGYWDTAVGGHITYGEQAEEALYREAAEELGIQAFNAIPIESYIYETDRERELIFVYAMIGHPNLDPDNGEVSEGKWWSVEELESAWEKDILTPNLRSEFLRVKDRLLSLL